MSNTSDTIDQLIEVLERVKRCDKAYNNLLQIRDNALFKEFQKDYIPSLFDDVKRKWAKFVYDMINESISLIEK